MKKTFFLFALLGMFVFGTSLKVDAQSPYTYSITKTITAADTITYTSVEGGVVMFEYNYTETSGTTAGKIYLEGKFLSAWVKLDSVSLSDVATEQTLRVTVTNTAYKSYRFRNTNTSSATGTVVAGYLRRPNGNREPEPLPIAKAHIPISPLYGDIVNNKVRLNYQVKYNWKGREVVTRRSFVLG